MPDRIIVIGASLNGITALMQLVHDLPKDLTAPVLITQHVASHSPGILPHLLSQAGSLPAVHPSDREELKPGHVYVAPPDRHMLVVGNLVRLSHGPKENMSRPAIDPLFRTAATAYGAGAVGVVLTGQLDDGTAGLLAIKDRGGVAIVQDPHEASAASMPQSALRHVAVDHICKIAEIPPLLVALAKDPPLDRPVGPIQLMEIENRIALGTSTVDDWWDLARASSPAGLSCPDCHCSLYEIADKRVVRFRCRSGHGYSAESLLSGQETAREALLASIYGALLEEAALAARLSTLPGEVEDAAQVTYLQERTARLRGEAEQVNAWMRTTTGLVAPEP